MKRSKSNSSYNIFIFLSIILLLFVIKIVYSIREYYSSVYDHPTKCFSCEREAILNFGPDMGWLGQPTKDFDSEKELIFRHGSRSAAFGAHPIRYYKQ